MNKNLLKTELRNILNNFGTEYSTTNGILDLKIVKKLNIKNKILTKIGNIQIPRRAQIIRAIFAEITRILNHLLAVGCHAMFVGAMALFWALFIFIISVFIFDAELYNFFFTLCEKTDEISPALAAQAYNPEGVALFIGTALLCMYGGVVIGGVLFLWNKGKVDPKQTTASCSESESSSGDLKIESLDINVIRGFAEGYISPPTSPSSENGELSPVFKHLESPEKGTSPFKCADLPSGLEGKSIGFIESFWSIISSFF